MRAAAEKIVSGERASEITRGWRAKGQEVALAHGRFDPLEAAHVGALSAARGGADRLAVEVAGDSSVAPAPVLGEAERALLVAALRLVDLVTIVAQPSAGATDVESAARTDLRARVRKRHGNA